MKKIKLLESAKKGGGTFNIPKTRDQIIELIKNDSLAIACQSIAQYRTMLLKNL